MATHGEIRWPPMGTFDGRLRGIPMAPVTGFVSRSLACSDTRRTVRGPRHLRISPLLRPQPSFLLCRAKALRNHNPRVGGSSPSSGIRSACKAVLSGNRGHAEYIPRVPRSDALDLAEPHGVVQMSLTFPSPGPSAGGEAV